MISSEAVVQCSQCSDEFWKEGYPKSDSDAKNWGQYHIVKDMGISFCMNILGTHRVLLGHIIDYLHFVFLGATVIPPNDP